MLFLNGFLVIFFLVFLLSVFGSCLSSVRSHGWPLYFSLFALLCISSVFTFPFFPYFFISGPCIFSIWNSLLPALHIFLFLTSCSCFTVQGLSLFPRVSASPRLAVCCVSPLRLSGAAAEPCSLALLENRLFLAAGSTEPGGLQGEPLGQSS